jgi:hypothetical protein
MNSRRVGPYLEPPTIPEGMTVAEYRINRPRRKGSGIRRLVRTLT